MAVVLLTSGLISLLSTGVQLFWEYRSDISELDQSLIQIEKGYTSSLATAAWAFDEPQIYTILQGILSLPDIIHVQVKTDFSVFELGDITTENKINQDSLLKTNEQTIGSFAVTATLDGLYSRLIDRFFIIFGSNIAKGFLTSFILFLLFNQIITRHIISLKDYISTISNENSDQPPKLVRNMEPFSQGRDELNELFHTIAKTVKSLEHARHANLSELQKRIKAEYRLQAINSNLESEVEKRTQTIVDQQATISNLATLNSMAEMAGGVAHEINNPLAIIDGHCNNLKRGVQSGVKSNEDVIESADKIATMVSRIAQVVNNLRTLARDASFDPVIPNNIAEVIQDALNLTREQIRGSGINLVEPSYKDMQLMVPCRRSQISQVLHHLLKNAKEATERCEEKEIKVLVEAQSDHIKISVEDTGKSIPPDLKDKIFQPFYTSKGVGTSGLGLSVSRSIIQDHKGELYFEEKSEGKSFSVILPTKIKKKNNNLKTNLS